MKIKEYADNSIVYGIFEVQKALETKINHNFKSMGLTYHQFLVLAALFFEKTEFTPKELHLSLQISKSQLSQHISQLESLKLLKRNISKSDARVTILTITSKGKDIARLGIKSIEKIEKEIEKHLSPSQQKSTLNFFKKLN